MGAAFTALVSSFAKLFLTMEQLFSAGEVLANLAHTKAINYSSIVQYEDRISMAKLIEEAGLTELPPPVVRTTKSERKLTQA